jgi:Prefoldin subunit
VLFNFELGNQVYAKARVKPTTKANLWLGADVMLEYPLDEATQLLVHQLLSIASSGVAVEVGGGDRPLATITLPDCRGGSCRPADVSARA